jgi:hypothetical protein
MLQPLKAPARVAAPKVASPHCEMGTWGQVDAGHGTEVGARLAGPIPLYWMSIVAVLAVGNAILPIPFAGTTPADIARVGARFNLFALALALGLSFLIGITWPRWWRSALVLIAPCPVPVVLIASGNIAPGCATLILAFVASWLGREIAAAYLGKFDLATGWAVSATFGLGLIAVYGFVAGTFGLLRFYVTWPVIALIALGLIAKARTRLWREVYAFALWLRRPAERQLMHFLLAGSALACFWLNLLGALSPEIRSDSIRQRLATAAYFARNGDLRADVRDLIVAREPSLGEITYAAILTVSPEQGAKLANFLVGLLCAAAIFVLARRLGGPLAGGLVAFAFYATSMASYLSQSTYLDLFTTIFAVTPALLLLLHQQPTSRTTAAAGVCLGPGVATKLHFSYVAFGLGVTLMLLMLRPRGVRRACGLNQARCRRADTEGDENVWHTGVVAGGGEIACARCL